MKPIFSFLLLMCVAVLTCGIAQAEVPSRANNDAFDRYAAEVEARLPRQKAAFASVHEGQPTLRRMTPDLPPPDLRGAMLHHWQGDFFLPGGRADELQALLRDVNRFPQRFAPQVERATALPSPPGHLLSVMRLRQHHVLTVVLDGHFDTTFPAQGYSISRSTRVDEIANAGTAGEHSLSDRENHGFLWRQNTYWLWWERDGGLYVRLETLSLTRDIPTGLGWAVRPFVESIPRESLAFTLQHVADALRHAR
ncbi:hypothetical protein ACFQBQ_03800 [Granulicella cerasi]|uniref:Uncharacterized protein n=1 Tax=Granulicella cerasi TaxID=741063 RepID=A0ABW1Z5P0_9BACT|nr:hypothetical protein [Granulicella cerasi]